MKFEKISDKKFETFKKNQVINPILISGGWIDTSNPGVSHDRYTETNKNGVISEDNFTSSANGTSISSDTLVGGGGSGNTGG